jgi:hypothetical protein
MSFLFAIRSCRFFKKEKYIIKEYIRKKKEEIDSKESEDSPGKI